MEESPWENDGSFPNPQTAAPAAAIRDDAWNGHDSVVILLKPPTDHVMLQLTSERRVSTPSLAANEVCYSWVSNILEDHIHTIVCCKG